MTQQQQLTGLLRRYIKDCRERDAKALRFTSQYNGRMAEHNGALQAVALLEAAEYERQKAAATQPALIGDGE